MRNKVGYLTRYNFKLVENKGKIYYIPCASCNGTGRIEKSLYEMVVAEIPDLSWINNLDEPHEWCEHDKDMLTLSKKFPDVVFQLNGEGEESGDVWVKYYKNGKVQEARLELD